MTGAVILRLQNLMLYAFTSTCVECKFYDTCVTSGEDCSKADS